MLTKQIAQKLRSKICCVAIKLALMESDRYRPVGYSYRLEDLNKDLTQTWLWKNCLIG
ncbi:MULTISPECIES: hypothetical protein [Fischerella]|uniref:hypothetical protein n=1 Tax=Fischerella TaxID=1190 RepID=UPI0012FB732B|nr:MULTISPECIES: hypothetical protein [Fischerella]MBD2431746.1 hypothetical protein [Fischerella sp. FACHB-380]